MRMAQGMYSDGSKAARCKRQGAEQDEGKAALDSEIVSDRLCKSYDCGVSRGQRVWGMCRWCPKVVVSFDGRWAGGGAGQRGAVRGS